MLFSECLEHFIVLSPFSSNGCRGVGPASGCGPFLFGSGMERCSSSPTCCSSHGRACFFI